MKTNDRWRRSWLAVLSTVTGTISALFLSNASWGGNYTETSPSVPWAEVVATNTNICATQTDNSLWCWGTMTGWQYIYDFESNNPLSLPRYDMAYHLYQRPTKVKNGSSQRLFNLSSASDTNSGSLDSTSIWCAYVVSPGFRQCWGYESQTAGWSHGAGMGETTLNGGNKTFFYTNTGVDMFHMWSFFKIGSHRGNCGIDSGHFLYCWGDVGLTSIMSFNSDPVQVDPYSDWQAVYSEPGTQSNVCALKMSGDLWCWGVNANGELGFGDKEPREWLTQVPLPMGIKFQKLVMGAGTMCGIDTDNFAWCAGGPIGLGSSSFSMAISTDDNKVRLLHWSDVAIAPAGDAICGLTLDGSRYCWGSGVGYKFGMGDSNDYGYPHHNPAETTKFAQITLTDDGGCGVTKPNSSGKNSLMCWGWGDIRGTNPPGAGGGYSTVPTAVTKVWVPKKLP